VQLRRLSWAGIEVQSDGWRIVIDPLENHEPFRHFAGDPRGPLVPVTIDEHTWALVSHVHHDHCDRSVLARIRPGQVVCHAPIASALALERLGVTPVKLWDTLQIGPFAVTPTPTQDWRGDDQVGWVVDDGTRRIIHGGDTIWHGNWYAIARRFAPFEVAFLPINGFIAQLEGFTPTDVPGSLTPEQAIEAAVILHARAACAIHHSLFDNPPRYAQQPDAIARFLAAGHRRGIRAIAPADGHVV
jgi:L-ascorbate metabolism protein UlaG (beta-lactamase superfamily)